MKNKKIIATVLVLMTALSLSAILSHLLVGEYIYLSAIALILGIIAYFVLPKAKDHSRNLAIFNLGDFKVLYKDFRLLLIFLLPSILNLLSINLAKLALVEYIEHVASRIGVLSVDIFPLLFIQLAISALGEEIAWRGFYQDQLRDFISQPLAILITALVFSLGHYAIGSFELVFYDLGFILLNSLCYGLLYQRTNNVLISSSSHLLANLTGILYAFLL